MSIIFTNEAFRYRGIPYVSTGLKNNRTRMLKSLSVLEKMHPDDTNVFASDIIDKCENWPDNLNSVCLADLASRYVCEKTDYLPTEPNEIKSCTVPLSNIDVKLNPSIIVLKNELGECSFQQVSKLKSPEENYLSLLQLYML